MELGAYAALDGAKRYAEVRALALDSVPASPDQMMQAATDRQIGMNNPVFHWLARWGMKVYGAGKYQNISACELAGATRNEKVLLLTGTTNDPWRNPTLALSILTLSEPLTSLGVEIIAQRPEGLSRDALSLLQAQSFYPKTNPLTGA